MSLNTMQKELLGDVPGIPLPYTKTLINRALSLIYEEQRWSFQVAQAGWNTPGLIAPVNPSINAGTSSGMITAQTYSNTITGNAQASAVWMAITGRPLITELQIRNPAYSLYSIIAADFSNPNAAVLTLDRNWMEPSGTQPYMMYQAYFSAPVVNFRKFVTIRDTTNNQWINFWQRDQQWLSVNDPQRTVFDVPTYAIPFQVNNVPNSPTLGNMLYELWPHPLSSLPYVFSYIFGGPLLQNPSDTVPYPLNEELVMWRAREVAYLWKESQKGDGLERGSGADWRFLAESAREEYKFRLKKASLLDVGLGDLYWNKFNRTPVSQDGYETMVGTLNVGTF